MQPSVQRRCWCDELYLTGQHTLRSFPTVAPGGGAIKERQR